MFCSPWLVVHLCTIFINSEIVKPQLVLQKSDAIYRMLNVSFARVPFVNATLACHTKRQCYRNPHTIHLPNLSIEQAMNTQKQVIKIYAATEYDKWTVTRTGFRFDLDREKRFSLGITLLATHYKLCTYILVYLSLCKLVKCFDY